MNANAIDRVFDVAPTGPFTAQFSYVRIRGGVTNGAGGGVYVGAHGEGKFSHAAISGNQAGVGGGIEGGRSGTSAFSNLRITSSTINGNKAGSFGGGIDAEGALTATNSTITGNNGSEFGGGTESPSNCAPLNLSSLTIVKNVATVDGGIRDNGNAGTLRNSIVALKEGPSGLNCSTCLQMMTTVSLASNATVRSATASTSLLTAFLSSGSRTVGLLTVQSTSATSTPGTSSGHSPLSARADLPAATTPRQVRSPNLSYRSRSPESGTVTRKR